MINKIAIIGDIHFGAKSGERDISERLSVELQQFLNYVKENDINIVQLNGDFFDRQLTFAEPAGLLALQFWTDLLDICRTKNIKIRCIEGTLTHDQMQVDVLSEFINYDENGNPDVDFKVFKTIGTEDLNGMHILYIPEEYPANADEYYGEYKKGKYDIIFLHGMWDFTGLANVAVDSANTANKAPFFIYNEWKDALTNGVCISGHYHGRSINKDMKVVYPGSFSAWKFDYDTERGWCYLEFDTDKHTYKYTLVNNTQAPKYKAVTIDLLPVANVKNAPIEEIKLAIDDVKKDCDYLRVDLAGLEFTTIDVLKKTYKGNKEIKIVDKANTHLTESMQLVKDEEVKNDEFAFVMDSATPIATTISEFITKKYRKTVSPEMVQNVITEGIDITKVLEA